MNINESYLKVQCCLMTSQWLLPYRFTLRRSPGAVCVILSSHCLLSALLRWNWGLDWQDGPVCDSAKWWTRVPHSGHDQCWKKSQIQLGPDGRLAWGARHSLHRHGQQLHGSWRAHWRSCVQRFATAFRFQRTGVHRVLQQSKHNYIYIRIIYIYIHVQLI